MKKELDLIENKELREECINRVEALEKVKQLLLIDGTDVATVSQVADFYEVGLEAIQSLYKDYKTELDSDGVVLKTKGEILTVLKGQLKNMVGKSIVTTENGSEIVIPNRGLKVFSRRAILRVGMLLRDSTVAKEVRTQLLMGSEV